MGVPSKSARGVTAVADMQAVNRVTAMAEEKRSKDMVRSTRQTNVSI
jgi:hypothetical protein